VGLALLLLLLLLDLMRDIVDVDDDNVAVLMPELRVDGLFNPNEWVNSD